MHKFRRAGAVAAGMAAALLIAACSDGAAGDAPPSSAPQQHAGHSAGAGIPSAQPLRGGERFETVGLAQPYTPSAPTGGTDEYRCFVVDPKLTTGAYLTGSQFLPQNTDLLHHVVVFQVPPSNAAGARAADDNSPGEGWTCFGDVFNGADAAWVASWAPGSNETLLSGNVGYPMQPGSLLILQVHYNLLSTAGKPGGADQSGIRLRLADGSKKLDSLKTMSLFAPIELPCAKNESGELCDRETAVADVTRRFGADVGSMEARLIERCSASKVVAGNTQRCDTPMQQAGTVYALAGHMHLLGRSVKIELNPGKANAKTLLDIPKYNFDDQAIRPLAKPLPVKAGDNLRLTCSHDAGLRKLLPQLRTLPPRYVVWGDGTSDEMCLGLVIFAPQQQG